jgi:hypothetical protein
MGSRDAFPTAGEMPALHETSSLRKPKYIVKW